MTSYRTVIVLLVALLAPWSPQFEGSRLHGSVEDVVRCGDDQPLPPPLALPERPTEVRPVAVPRAFVGGYLEAYRDLLPRDLPETYDLLIFAFARIDEHGGVVFDHEQPDAALREDIRARNAAGKPTLVSIGGAGGAESGLHAPEERQRFLDEIIEVIDAYGFSGVDWDLERGIPGGISTDGIVAVSLALRQRYGEDFAVTLAPYDTPEITSAYQEIAGRLRDHLTFVGFQFYNGPQPPTPGSVLAVTDAWLTACRLAPSQWALGFVRVDDNLGHTTPLDRMAEIYEHVDGQHPGIRGVWTWAIADRDRPVGYRFANTMSDHLSR